MKTELTTEQIAKLLLPLVEIMEQKKLTSQQITELLLPLAKVLEPESDPPKSPAPPAEKAAPKPGDMRASYKAVVSITGKQEQFVYSASIETARRQALRLLTKYPPGFAEWYPDEVRIYERICIVGGTCGTWNHVESIPYASYARACQLKGQHPRITGPIQPAARAAKSSILVKTKLMKSLGFKGSGMFIDSPSYPYYYKAIPEKHCVLGLGNNYPSCIFVFRITPKQFTSFQRGRLGLIPPNCCNASGGTSIENPVVLYEGPFTSSRHVTELVQAFELTL